MEAILQCWAQCQLPGIAPVAVIASKEDIGAIEKARAYDFERGAITVISPRGKSQEQFGQEILTHFESFGVTHFGQYGWMPLTPPAVVKAFAGCSINQHPGPLDPGRPDFGGKGMYGIRVHAAVLHFLRMLDPIDPRRDSPCTEVTAQRVACDFDEGGVLGWRCVQILEGDTPEQLQQRALPLEHRLQIETLIRLGEGRLTTIERTDGPYVFPEEDAILATAKNLAIEDYP